MNSKIKKTAGAVMTMAASVLLLSCEKEQPGHDAASAGEKVPVEVSIPESAKTRVTDVGNEDMINNLQVFVFRPDGALDAYAMADDSRLVIECTSGQKEFVAVINAPQLTAIQSRSQLAAMRSDLSHNSVSGLVMTGTATKTLSSVEESVEIVVSRLAARVSVSKITNAFSAPGYASTPIVLKAIYISNVAADACYLDSGQPTKWYNTGGSKKDCPALLCDDALNAGITKSKPYTTPHYFYCYANPADADSSGDSSSPQATRLVIETQIRNVTYYYPVDIPEIAANHTYDVKDVKITRLGSEDPDQMVETGAVSVTIRIKDWDTGHTTEITI